jgi:hypothetical protein
MAFKDVFKQAYTGEAVKVNGVAPYAGSQVAVVDSKPEGEISVYGPNFVGPIPPASGNYGGAPAVPTPARTSTPAIDFQPSFKDVFTRSFNHPLRVTGVDDTPAPTPPQRSTEQQPGTDLLKSVQPKGKSLPERILTPIANTVIDFLSGPINYTKDLADIYAENKISEYQANAPIQTVGKQAQSSERMGETGVFNKTAGQFIGDAAQAVLTFYTPTVGNKLLEAGMSKTVTKQIVKELAKQGLKEGVTIGLPFGVAQALSNGTKDPAQFAKIVLTTTTLSAGLGTLASAGLPALKLAVHETQSLQKHLAELGISNQSGFLRLFESPKAQELGKKINELNEKMVNAPNQTLYKRYKKALEAAKVEYRKETQAGFVKNPLFKEEPESLPTGKPAQAGSPRTAKNPAKASEDISYNPTVAKDNVFYNVDRLNISKEAKQAVVKEIQNVGNELQKTVGKPLSNKEVVAIADNTSKILNRTVTRDQTADRIAANLNLRRKIANAAKDGKIDQEFIELWIKDKSQGEDIARQLQARRVNADPKEASLIDTILSGILKENQNADDIINAAKGVDFNDPKQVTELFRKFVKPKTSEWIDLLRYNSMLSSPQTHITNAISNFQGTGILAPIEKTITGVLDATKAALTGSERKYFVGEGKEFAKGYYSNLKEATRRFTDVMRGRALIQNPDTRNIPLATKGAKASTEKVLAFPTRLLEASDQFFTALTEGGSKRALKYKVAKGGKVGNIERAASDEAAKRLFRSETGLKEQGYVLDAIDKVTNSIQALRNSDNAIASTIAKFTLPFIRTPTNILKQGIEYSPAGLITLPGASNKTEQLAKVIMGLGTSAGAATLLGSDRLTWAEPTNPDQKAAFRAAGRQSYSVKVGDHWISYSKLHPALAFNFALVAAIDDAQKNKKLSEGQGESILSAFAKWGNFLADQSYLKSIGDFVAATKGDAGGWSKYISNYPQQLIPFRALMSWVTRLTDPVQRRADPDGSILEKQMQQLMSQIPGLAQLVPERTDAQGNPIENQNRILNSVSPNRITTENPDQEEAYKTALEAKKLDRDQREKKEQLAVEARKKYEVMKQSPQDFKADLKAIAKANPALAEKILDLYEADQKNLSYTDRTIKSLDVKDGSRAQFIYAKIQGMDKGEKKAYLLDLAKKGVLTDEVLDQVLELSQ